jgi:hypothetical protein
MRAIRVAAGAAVAFCVSATPLTAAQKPAPQPSKAAGTEAARLEPAPATAHKDGADAQPDGWSQVEIDLALAHCTAALKGVEVVALPAPPIREGECGAPAPMQVISIGKSPQVSFSPPATITCDMIAALYKWLERDVQPLARKYLGAPIMRIETMSSYSCRNALGRPKKRLSEHGRANALDIRAFVTIEGRTAQVVADWGMTAREVEAQVAARKAAEGTAVSSDRPAPVEAQPGVGPGRANSAPSVLSASAAAAPAPAAAPSSQPTMRARPTDLDAAPAQRLGGPDSVSQPLRNAAPDAAADGPNAFLRAAHKSACRIFGTVLGPEANDAHKNHFHLDMAERPNGSFCE